ncbi:MAG: hypothetical protein ACLUI5_01105 [Fusicatenibacter saccharivorans]
MDYSGMKGQQVELRTIIQNLSNTQAKTVTLRLWVEHSNGEKRSRQMGSRFSLRRSLTSLFGKRKANSGQRVRWITRAATLIPALSTALWFDTIPENAILQSGDTIGFEIVDHATGEVLADDDTEQQRYVNVTIQYQLEDGTDVPNTMPTTFTVPVGKRLIGSRRRNCTATLLLKRRGWKMLSRTVV